jgi:hypothetical protein
MGFPPQKKAGPSENSNFFETRRLSRIEKLNHLGTNVPRQKKNSGLWNLWRSRRIVSEHRSEGKTALGKRRSEPQAPAVKADMNYSDEEGDQSKKTMAGARFTPVKLGNGDGKMF